MIFDLDKLETLPQTLPYDVCIAGAGVAGITIAKVLAANGKRIALLEGGSLDFSQISQDNYKGEISGHDYLDLDVVRLRYLGGSSNHWGGFCRPLDKYDFLEREHIPWSGWPIRKTDIQPYYEETLKILNLKPFRDDILLASSSTADFKDVEIQISPLRFKKKYFSLLDKSKNIDLILNANLVDIKINPEDGRVEYFKTRGYRKDTKAYLVKAGEFVLALGGIENARNLLNSNSQTKAIINKHDLLGRFFMEHPHFDVGALVSVTSPLHNKFRRYLSPSESFINKNQTANFALYLYPVDENTSSIRSTLKYNICKNETIADFVKTVRPTLACATSGLYAAEVRVAYEQVPNFKSRVELSSKKDHFGLPEANLNWQLSPIDKKTVKVALLEFAKFFATENMGRVKIDEWVLDDSDELPGLKQGHRLAGPHHMGTTRMGLTEKTGVVDKNCLTFGTKNLYIAGSSVFCTAGHANPTFSIVQLSLRLADHLAKI